MLLATALEGVSTDLPCERPPKVAVTKHVAHADTRLPRETTLACLQERQHLPHTGQTTCLLTALATGGLSLERAGGGFFGPPEGHGRED